jgi:hypothetical protein
MDPLTPAMLAQWQNFYVVVGSAAGALTGLQFVVITLVAQARAAGNERDIHAFGTPTVIHFCTALLLSALMTAPWQSVAALGALFAAGGLAGIGYSFRVLSHARQAAYDPDLSDRLWYLVFPTLAHVLLLAAAVLIWRAVPWSPALLAADALLFLLLGVHNSWDTVTYVAVKHAAKKS